MIKKLITLFHANAVVRRGEPQAKRKNFPANRFYRADLGLEFKSSMEANYWRFLQQICKGIKSNYELEVFYFPTKDSIQNKFVHQTIKTANPYSIKAYVPDFKITSGRFTWFVEVKGIVDKISLEKARLFKTYYPWYRLYFVTYKSYNKIKKLYSHRIKGWE